MEKNQEEKEEEQETLSSIFAIIELDDLFVVGIDEKIKSVAKLKSYIQKNEKTFGEGISKKELILKFPDIETIIAKAKEMSEVLQTDESNLKVMFWKEEVVR